MDQDGPVGSIEQFLTLHQLCGRPIAVVDLEVIKLELLSASQRSQVLHSTWRSTQATEDSPLVEGVDSLKRSV
jgi:hypothetical protein